MPRNPGMERGMMTFKRPVIGLELKCLSIEFFLTRTDIYLVNMQKYKMVDAAFILPKGIYQKKYFQNA